MANTLLIHRHCHLSDDGEAHLVRGFEQRGAHHARHRVDRGGDGLRPVDVQRGACVVELPPQRQQRVVREVVATQIEIGQDLVTSQRSGQGL